MSYHRLLVGLADTDTAPRVMAAASALAADHGAHLVAVHVVPSGLVREGGVPVVDATERLRGVYEAHRDDAAFSSEWQVIDDNALSAAGALVELGNACDALVLGQRHGQEANRSAWHLGEHVVGVTARPVLLVPDTGGTSFSAERVLLAWDGEAIATRAAFDALPLLQRAKHVRVHRFNPPPSERRHVSGVSEGFADTLSRHGVPVELSHSDAGRFEIGEDLLAFAADEASDLLVMGCRPRNRVREFLLGDTTRHVFQHASLPVLMGG